MDHEKIAGTRLLVCNCQRTMDIDGRKLARALGRDGDLPVHTELCRGNVAAFEAAVVEMGPVTVACTQEAALFREVAAEKAGSSAAEPGDEERLTFVNIRERAGWCEKKGAALPKMAALIAEAAYAARPAATLTVSSKGVCLVYGKGQLALDTAAELAARLSPSLLLLDADDALPPSRVMVPIHKGRITKARGSLGAFEIEVAGYAPVLPSSRANLEFAMARDGAKSQCDLILDLSGGAPLFPDAARRDGYLRADPANPAAVARAMLAATDMVGEFEKPRYVAFEAGICAHARSGKVGCRNCLDVCPTGAIAPAGDHVAIDAAVCGGCGGCNAVCPTGAVSYAYPRREDLIGRAQVLIRTYLRAGGRDPVLLVHDDSHGGPLIAAMARLGRGLPANVLPLAVHSVHQVGHDLTAAMLTAGAGEIVLLANPAKPDELPASEAQAALMNAIATGLGYAGPRVRILAERDPDVVEAALYDAPRLAPLTAHAFTAIGAKRSIARTVLAKLFEAAPKPVPVLALPKGAPYGRILVRTDGCTLCLSCVGACPANALADNPDRPQLSFTEAACVQCGICVATCPEKVISLEPRLDFSGAAMTPVVVKQEEPFNCLRCGKPFGTKSSVERVMARLKGQHAMFQSEARARLIGMCNDCRVISVAEEGGDPLGGGPRPKVRTTDDYLAEVAAGKAPGPNGKTGGGGPTPDDFLS